MKNIHEVLNQKKAEVEKLMHEIAALEIVAPMLAEESFVSAGQANTTANPASTPPGRTLTQAARDYEADSTTQNAPKSLERWAKLSKPNTWP